MDYYFNLVGVTYDNRQSNISKLKTPCNVYLVCDEENEYDKNAVKVLSVSGFELGFIPKKYSKTIFELIQNENIISSKAVEIVGGDNLNYGLKICITTNVNILNKKEKNSLLFLLKEDNTFEVYSGPDFCETEIKIPSYYKNREVTSIGEKAFYNCKSIVTIDIPSTVKYINEYAFYGASNLQNINLNEGLERICDYAFSYCDKINTLVFPNSLKFLSANSLNNSFVSTISNLKLRTLSEYNIKFNCGNLKEYKNSFYLAADDNDYAILIKGYKKSKKLEIHPNTKIIGYGAFDNDDDNSFEIIELPEGLIAICEYAFRHNDNLYSIILPKSLKYLSGFSSTGLTSLIIPPFVEKIGNHAFCHCESLINVFLPNSVHSIGYAAFDGCLNLKELSLPNSLKEVGPCRFGDCSNLVFTHLPNNLEKMDNSVFYPAFDSGKTGISKNIIKSENCTYEYIGDVANPCFYLANITPENPFFDFKPDDRTAFISGNALRTWYYYCIKNKCFGHQSFYIGRMAIVNNILEDSWSMFTNPSLSKFNSFIVSSFNPYYTEINGVLYSKNLSKIIAANNSVVHNYKILDEVNEIYEKAFFNIKKLESLTIGLNVSKIGNGAFESCENLRTVNVLSAIKRIPKYAFARCLNLEYIELDDRIEIIDYCSFLWCESLRRIILPKFLRKISLDAFYKCAELSLIEFKNKYNWYIVDENNIVQDKVDFDDIKVLDLFKNDTETKKYLMRFDN